MPQPPTDLESLRKLPAFNNSATNTIPAFGLIQSVSVDGGTDTTGGITVDLPTADNVECYLCLDLPIPPKTWGLVTKDWPWWAAYSSGSPVNGQTWGAASGSYYLTSGKTGFYVEGGANNGRVMVRGSAAASTPSPGPTVNLLIAVCGIYDSSGDMVGLSNMLQPITLPSGTTLGDIFCVFNPTNCCDGVSTECCPDDEIPQTLYVSVSGNGGCPIDGVSGTLTYNTGGSWPDSWSGIITNGSCGLDCVLQCITGSLVLSVYQSVGDATVSCFTPSTPTVVCNPFSWTATFAPTETIPPTANCPCVQGCTSVTFTIYGVPPSASAVIPSPPTDATIAAQRKPCKHRGEAIGLQLCDSCAGKVNLKTFACDVHGKCTLAKPLDGFACCKTCPDYNAN